MSAFKKTFLIIFLIAASLATTNVSAQFSSPAQSAAALTIKLNPSFPDPGSEVKATLISLSTDLNRATVTWTLNGKTLAKGKGVKEVSFKAASHGSKNTLSASVTTPEAELFQATLIIQPQTADIMIESKSRIPDWYEGAALPSSQSKILVTAMPNFISGKTKLSAASLNYEWRFDDRFMRDISGLGKQTISLLGESKTISVKISSPDGALVKEAFTTFRSFQPEVLFYQRKPLEGLLTSLALRTVVISAGDKIETEAVPFYMNYSSNSDLGFAWRLNGNSTQSLAGEPRVLDITTVPESRGQSASIEILITNLKNIYEKVANSFNAKVE